MAPLCVGFEWEGLVVCSGRETKDPDVSIKHIWENMDVTYRMLLILDFRNSGWYFRSMTNQIVLQIGFIVN